MAFASGDALLVDLDVEEPNSHLFFVTENETRENAFRKVPFVTKEKCTLCGNCAKVCEFHAIVSLPTETLVFDELCHACGACSRFCPEGAIVERDHPIGEVIRADVPGLRGLTYGKLRVGEASATALVRRVKKEIPTDCLTIIDCPPGTACPAVESMRDSDLCVLVTEPTPFGFHDLKLALAVAKKLRLPHAVFINKAGLPGPDVHEFCAENGISIVGELAFERGIAESYSRGELLASNRRYSSMFKSTLKRINEEAERARKR